MILLKNWYALTGMILLTLSAALYSLHYLIFGDVHHIFIYLLGDIAFLPIEVLLVTMIIHRLLNEREKQIFIMRLNMVIGVFFNEFGVDLLKRLSSFDPLFESLKEQLVAGIKTHNKKEFDQFCSHLKNSDCAIDSRNGDLTGLQNFLVEGRSLLLRLLENPNLLEHESFTELLWAVLHLNEELSFQLLRTDADYEHLSGDMKRAYCLLFIEWMKYMRHLRDSYPYLFSLIMRMNVLDLPPSLLQIHNKKSLNVLRD